MKLKLLLPLVILTFWSPGCVVMRDPVVLNHATVTVAMTPPASQKPETKSESAPTSAAQKAMETLAREVEPFDKEFGPPLAFPPPAAGATDKKSHKCELRIPPPPELPQITPQEYKQIDPSDKDALIRALTSHVKELVVYSREYQARVRRAEQQYLKDCKK